MIANQPPAGSGEPEDQPIGRGAVVDSRGALPFPVVGIGASAGGLEALTGFFSELPTDTGMAFIVVEHLAPDRESRLAELLARAAKIPIQEAEHGLRIDANHAYVIAPNTTLSVRQGVLAVTPRGDARAQHLPVDHLFRSLATEQQRQSIAIVLSGTGSDGTQGVCEIKAVGGITFAQSPETAAHPGMPGAAAESGCVDFVLPPGEIAKRLGWLGRHPYLEASELPLEQEPTADGSYQQILAAVRAHTGVDFSLYRDTTIKRRIMRRMAVHGQSSLQAYAERLGDDAAEVNALYQDLLINVTSFFRDPEVFELLKQTVFPELLAAKTANDPFRIWVPGCSTGQEAYSLAMALTEFLDRQPVRPPIQIFATDLAEPSVLDRARAGIYPEGIEDEVSTERLRRFFRREDHVYRIDKAIRDACVFARQNITIDPPFSRLDLISCRNVLIYFQSPLQKRILPIFHYALNQPGYLLLGSAETIGEFSDLFDLEDRIHRVYAKRAGPGRPHLAFPAGHFRPGFAFRQQRSPAATAGIQDVQREADRVLLHRYAPPGVLVDDRFEILQFRGRTGAYLEVPPGEPTANLLRMARDGLFLELRNALTEAQKVGQRVRRDGVRIRAGGGEREVSIEVVPITPVNGGTSYLVLFHDDAGSPTPPAEPLPAPVPPPGDGAGQLRQELAATREYLQSMVEQQDASNEELRSANEEILSSNEELQSTNEELETAKEELQSANEELTTVNEQLHRRNRELDHLNNDLTNLLSSSAIPVVMVGPDLRVRRVTPAARRVMNILPTDADRPLEEIKLAAVPDDFERLVGQVIETVRPVEREVRDRDGRWYMMRIHPYRTGDHRIDGAVIVLVDVDELRRTKESLQAQADLLGRQHTLLELSQDAIIVRDGENRILTWNRGAQEMYGWSPEEARGRELAELLGTDRAVWAEVNGALDRTGVWEGELHQTRRDGGALVVQSREVLLRDDEGHRSAVLSIKRDITELGRMVAALQQADRRKDEFLATLAHELRNPLAPIRNAGEIIHRAGGDRAAISRACGILDRQVQQLTRIVDDLIDLSRVVEKKIDLRRDRVELGTIVATAVETGRSAIEARSQQLDLAVPDPALQLDVDPVRIAQVVINLLQNAARYTPAGGHIWLSAARVEAATGATPDGQVEIRIRDTGMGIEPELLPEIFDAFTQGAPGPSSPLHRGLGVGLTLVRSLVEMHGGTVEARSAGAGQGSEFVVRLPLATGPAPAAVASLPPPSPAPPRRVLVVDDNEDQLQSLGLLLELMGHQVRLVADGDAAIVAADEFQPDVALIDIGLPGMSGYDVARRLRQDPRRDRTLLVAQTGWGQEPDRRRSVEAGFDHHMVKPLSMDFLERILTAPPRVA